MSRMPWPKVKEAFVRVLEASGPAREEILKQCSLEPGLRTEVLSLLAAHEGAQYGLGDSNRPWTEAGMELHAKVAPGEMIGKYRIVRLIDSGGMGSVFEAIDTTLDRSVAVKLLHNTLLTESMRTRFDEESRILARLRHPAIAQVYESGTYTRDVSGTVTPFIAMEFIPDAHPIDQWVRERTPTRNDVLKMFIRVCEAIQHGHQRGVVHRDIKPANILIDGGDAPKVIDFGVAQALEESRLPPQKGNSGKLVGTLGYMSPESCSGDPLDVDVRSDVYSLGVVLYELLTGQVPYRVDTGSVADAIRVIRGEVPRKVSEHDHSLAGDLEAIVETAMQKDREQRYQSATELAADIQRFLGFRPVQARHSSAAHVVHLFAKRNRFGMAAGIAVAIALVTGMTGLAIGLSRARAATREALMQSERATRSADFLINTLRSASPLEIAGPDRLLWDPDLYPYHEPTGWGSAGAPGKAVSARDMISLAAEKVKGQFHDDPVLRADMLALLAETLRETGLDPRTESFSRESLHLNEATFGPLHRRTILSHLQCAHEARLKNDFATSLFHSKVAYEASHRALGPTDKLSRACVGNYASALLSPNGDVSVGEQLLRDQYRIIEGAFGADSQELLVETVRLGSLVENASEALGLLRKAQGKLESQGKRESLLWAETSLQIASVLSTQCESQKQAVESYLLARTTLDRLTFPLNPRSIEITGELIKCYVRLGQADVGVAYSREIAAAHAKRNHPGTIGAFIGQGKHARILALAGTELEYAEKSAHEAAIGVDLTDPVTSEDWATYFVAVRAQALRKLARPEEALAAIETRLPVVLRKKGAAWASGFLYNEQTESLAALGRIEEARIASRLAMEIARDGFVEPIDQCHAVYLAIRVTAERLETQPGR